MSRRQELRIERMYFRELMISRPELVNRLVASIIRNKKLEADKSRLTLLVILLRDRLALVNSISTPKRTETPNPEPPANPAE